MSLSLPTYLLIEKGPVTTLTLNRPSKHNALNPELIQALTDALQDIDQDPAVHLVVLKAKGDSFCAGADLQWMQSSACFTDHENCQDASRLGRLMQTLYQLKQPTLALVTGPAMGGGVGLIACCDMVVASEHTHFVFPEVKLGLVPAVIAPYILHAIGPRAALYYFLTTETLSAQKACDLGLVHHTVDRGRIEDMFTSLVHRILENEKTALWASKRWVHHCAPISPTLTHAAIKLTAKQRASAPALQRIKQFLHNKKHAYSE